jgi:hypothetical protein
VSLVTGAATSDRVNFGNPAELNNLAAFTVGGWYYPTTLTNLRRLVVKGGFWALRLTGTSGNLIGEVPRATTSGSATTNNTPFSATNSWRFVALTWDIAASPTLRIFAGSLSSPVAECTYSAQASGSGAQSDDSAAQLIWANNAGATNAFQGRNGVGFLYDRVLSLGEMRQQQFAPYRAPSCQLFCHFGWSGVSTQADLSGNANHGTITGGSLGPHVPLGPAFGHDYGYTPPTFDAGPALEYLFGGR